MTEIAALSDIKIGSVTRSWAEAHNFTCNYTHETTSTNSLAKEDTNEDLDPIQLYITEYQTAGRGRHDHIWNSAPSGTSLLSSWSFASDVAPTPYLTSLLGLALYNAATATWPFLNWNLKAPNDLYINDLKIAGLLVETISQGKQTRIIIGLGLNVLAHPDLAIATNLFSELQKIKKSDEELFPLMGDDWIRFLDRWLFEICLIMPEANKEPDFTARQALIHVFNKHPKLGKPYSSFDNLKEDLWR